MSAGKQKILVVEDEHGIADTLEFALRSEGFEPTCVATGEAALKHLAVNSVALVILDIGLPDLNGFELFKRLREQRNVPVVFLTSRSHEVNRVVGLELGADDYISKPFSPRELVARVRAVLRRTQPTDETPGPAQIPGLERVFHVDAGRRTIRYYGEPLELSRYEFGLLCALVGRPGHVFTREALLHLVWEDADSLDRTVDAHVKTLRAKLRRITPELDPIRTFRGTGYALAEDLPGPATAVNRRTGIFIGLVAAYVAGVALLLWRQVSDIDPRYRESAEESLVETANLLATIIEEQWRDGGMAPDLLDQVFRSMNERKLNANIYGVQKTRIDMRIRVVDTDGRVAFDSLQRDVGADYSQWRDVRLALEGEYGARTTQDIPGEPSSSVMYVAAPLIIGGHILGAVSVGKPEASFGQFANAARRNTVYAGLIAAGATLVLGLLLSLWFVVPQGLIVDHLRQLRAQRSLRLPALLRHSAATAGTALRDVRDALAGNSYAADYVQTLTHELKGPLSTIRGAAELLRGPMSDADRDRFLSHVLRETDRIQLLVDRMMELAALEARRRIESPEPVALAPLLHEIATAAEAAGAPRGIRIRCVADGYAYALGDSLLLRQAIGNLIDNARDFSPDGALVELQLRVNGEDAEIAVLDEGTGLPQYARDQAFQKFFSLQRPASGRRSTGLGLAFVREIAHLHHGQAELRNRPEGGAEAILRIPLLPFTQSSHRR